MIIRIIGTESLGVRGLSCSIELKDRKIVIDPGVALGWMRYRHLPHPFQAAVGAGIRETILRELQTATDVILSHFDGDHVPLQSPNPYQLGIERVRESVSKCRVWAKGPDRSSPNQQRRRKDFIEGIKTDVRDAEGAGKGPLAFSAPVPHGQQQDGRDNTVMMSRIEEDGTTFVHASDIQLLDEATVRTILDWKPDIVLASGPPLYRYSPSSAHAQREIAWKNAVELSQNVDTLILDHHLLRSDEGVAWLEKLKRVARHRVCCAAEYMQRQPIFLEAWRKKLYEWLPVPHNWHDAYQEGKVDFDAYRIDGWAKLIENNKLTPCKWYLSCPVKAYTDRGILDRYWIENYCLVSNKHCVRYHMEEKGESHPDSMLPNGEIKEGVE